MSVQVLMTALRMNYVWRLEYCSVAHLVATDVQLKGHPDALLHAAAMAMMAAEDL